MEEEDMKNKHSLVLKINQHDDNDSGISGGDNKNRINNNEDAKSDDSSGNASAESSPPITIDDDGGGVGGRRLSKSSGSSGSPDPEIFPTSGIGVGGANRIKLRSTKSVDPSHYRSMDGNESSNSSDSGEMTTKPRVRYTKSMDMGQGQQPGGGHLKNRLPRAVPPAFYERSSAGGEINAALETDSTGGVAPGGSGRKQSSEPPESFTFDPNDEIYMANACCECMHYKTSAVVVAVLEIALIVVWALLISLYYSNVGHVTARDSWAISVQTVLGAVLLASIVSMLAGVVLENHLFLYPYMAVQLLAIGSLLLLTFLAVVVMAVGSDLSEKVFGFIFGPENLPKIEQNFGPIWPFCLAVVFDFGAALGIWFYVLIKGYYDYLQDKQFFEKLTRNGFKMTTTSGQQQQNGHQMTISNVASSLSSPNIHCKSANKKPD